MYSAYIIGATPVNLSVAWLLGSSGLGGRVSWTWKTIYSFDTFTAPLEKLEVDSRNSKRYSLIRFIPTGFRWGCFGICALFWRVDILFNHSAFQI